MVGFIFMVFDLSTLGRCKNTVIQTLCLFLFFFNRTVTRSRLGSLTRPGLGGIEDTQCDSFYPPLELALVQSFSGGFSFPKRSKITQVVTCRLINMEMKAGSDLARVLGYT